MKKRLLSMFLCVLMVLCVFPFTASAATYIDYNYGITIETPHPGRNPDYKPTVLDTRFISVETFWFDMSGYEYNRVQPTDKFVEGKDYLLIVKFRYNASNYYSNSSTISYINYTEAHLDNISNESASVQVLQISQSYKCNSATLTGTSSPSVTVSAPVAWTTPSSTVTVKNSYDSKVESTAAEWYKVDYSKLDLGPDGNVKTNADALTISATKMGSTEQFYPGFCYAVMLAVTPETGYKFDSKTTLTINDVLAKGIYGTGVISAMRLFVCPGEVKHVVVDGIESPVAGRFANPFFEVPIGSIYGQNTIMSSFSSAIKKADGTLPIKGENWSTDEANVKVFECGKNYLYMQWDGYSNSSVSISDDFTVYVNGVVADAYTNLGNSVMLYKLYKNIHCDASDQFVDMRPKSHWAHNALDFAYANRFISGTSGNTISPKDSLTRAMVVQILWSYVGEPEEGTNQFTDVKTGSWYEKAVTWANHNGIVSGQGDGIFNPKGVCTREQLAVILKNFAEYIGVTTEERDDLTAFGDVSKVHSWALESVQWAVSQDIIAGSDGNLLPRNNCTREQFASILMSFVLNKDCPPTTIIGNNPQ